MRGLDRGVVEEEETAASSVESQDISPENAPRVEEEDEGVAGDESSAHNLHLCLYICTKLLNIMSVLYYYMITNFRTILSHGGIKADIAIRSPVCGVLFGESSS